MEQSADSVPESLLGFCQRLRRLQRESGISQRDLARAVHLSEQRMSDILNGKTRGLPKWRQVQAMVEACRDRAAVTGRTLPPDLAEAEPWQSRYFDLEQDLDAARARVRRRRPAAGPGRAVMSSQPAEVAESPVAENADLDARVHGAVNPIPYVTRDIEDEVRDHIGSGRAVLLVGPSMVGKTRMAVTLIKDLLAGRRLVIPGDRAALAALGTAVPTVSGSVIFLDDIERLIGAGGVLQAAVRQLAEQNLVIGTIRSRVYARFVPTDRLRPPEWDVLAVFQRVFIDRSLSAADQDRLAVSVPDPAIRQRILRVGVGEYVGAAERVAEAMRLGPEVNPAGFALVRGAADWARVGMRAPTPDHLLRVLAAPYLDARDRLHLDSEQGHADALAWATLAINRTVSLLQPEQASAFSVYDYALDLLSGRGEPVPATTWPVLIDNASPEDLVGIGSVAHTENQYGVAEQAWRTCEGSGHADAAPFAALYLGAMLKEHGEVEEARAAYERAIVSGHADAAPAAQYNLGNLLSQQANTEAAQVLYRKAIGSQHPMAAPRAAFHLGSMIAADGDLSGAIEVYQNAAKAEIDLFELQATVRDRVAQQAREAGRPVHFEFIDARGRRPDAEIIAKIAADLGGLLARQGDASGARWAYLYAAWHGRARVASGALLDMGNLFRDRGKVDAAEAAFSQAIELRDPDIAPKAAANLGLMLHRHGDREGARLAYRKAIEADHPEASPLAAFNLGVLLADGSDLDQARDAFQYAAAKGNPDIRESALRRIQTLHGPGQT